MSVATNRLALEELHTIVAEELVSRIKSGEAKPADLAVAVKFLKDNGVDALASDESPLKRLAQVLPFSDTQLTQIN
ncbi:MAG: hypothetical protein EBV19_05715 [Flavobacteriia bacterium]|nr:hypothetical protein [Flavobacteriia bacterium]